MVAMNRIFLPACETENRRGRRGLRVENLIFTSPDSAGEMTHGRTINHPQRFASATSAAKK